MGAAALAAIAGFVAASEAERKKKQEPSGSDYLRKAIAARIAKEQRNAHSRADAIEAKIAREDAAEQARWEAEQRAKDKFAYEHRVNEHSGESKVVNAYHDERARLDEHRATGNWPSARARAEPYRWVRDLNPPPWLSISGSANFDVNFFTEQYVGVTNINQGIGEILFFQSSDLRLTSSVIGVRNPKGVVNINVTSGALGLNLGKIRLSVNPRDATIAVTLKTPDPNNPDHWFEDTLAHNWNFNWGYVTNSFITARSEAVLDTANSDEDFAIIERKAVNGRVRTVKTAGIVLTASAVFAIILISGAILSGSSIGELILQGSN